jgi:hypothetical protein
MLRSPVGRIFFVGDRAGEVRSRTRLELEPNHFFLLEAGAIVERRILRFFCNILTKHSLYIIM